MVVVMCKKTGIKHVYQNWDEACIPGGPGGVPPASCDRHRRHGRACEVRAVGAGLKLVYIKAQCLLRIYVIDHVSDHCVFILSRVSGVCQKCTSWTNKCEHSSFSTTIIYRNSSPPQHHCYQPPPIPTVHPNDNDVAMPRHQPNRQRTTMDGNNLPHQCECIHFDGVEMTWHVNGCGMSSRQWWCRLSSLSTLIQVSPSSPSYFSSWKWPPLPKNDPPPAKDDHNQPPLPTNDDLHPWKDIGDDHNNHPLPMNDHPPPSTAHKWRWPPTNEHPSPSPINHNPPGFHWIVTEETCISACEYKCVYINRLL